MQDKRIVDATLRCVGRWGLAKTTLDDVAREAGCSRATVYRLFPGGKDSLFGTLVNVPQSAAPALAEAMLTEDMGA